MTDLSISNAYAALYPPPSQLRKKFSRNKTMKIPGTMDMPSQRSVERNKAIFVVSHSDQRIIPNKVCPVLRHEPSGKHIHCETNHLRKSLQKQSPTLHNVGQKMAVPPAPPSHRFVKNSDENRLVIRHGSPPRRSLSLASSSSAADNVVDNDRWFMSSPKSTASPRKPVRKTFPSSAIVSPRSRWHSPQDSSPKSPRRILSSSRLRSIDTATLEGACSAGSLPSPPMVRRRKDPDGVTSLATETMYISSVWLES